MRRRARAADSLQLSLKIRLVSQHAQALAPCASYVRAIATGSKSSRITPFDGLAFFTSAISLIGGPAANGEKKSRTGGASVNCRSSSAPGCAGLRCRDFASFRRDDVVENRHRLMLKMPPAGEEHGESLVVASGDHLIVAGASRRAGSGTSRRTRRLPEWNRRRERTRRRPAPRLGPLAGFIQGNADGIDATHLSGTHSQQRLIFRYYDCI